MIYTNDYKVLNSWEINQFQQAFPELNIESIDVEIEFRISGKYIPATQWEPEEFPELLIENIAINAYYDYDNKIIAISEKQSKLFEDCLDFGDLEEELWKYYRETTDTDRAEYLIAQLEDRKYEDD